MVKTQNQLS